MTAPRGWQKGSFRGVAFVARASDASGGRRGVQHEFPQAEIPVWEDFGRRAGSFTLDCHIVGEDYLGRARALSVALDAPGAGTLVHPWLGSMQVGVGDWSRSDAVADGDIATFSITFLESGLPAQPAAAADTPALSQAAAAGARAHIPTSLAGGFSIAGAQGFVEEHAAGMVAAAGAAIALAANTRGGVGAAIVAIQAQTGILPASLQAQLRDPATLAQTMIGAIRSLALIGGNAPGLAGSLLGLLGFGDDLTPITGDTPARTRQRANRAAFVHAINLATAAELVEAGSNTAFASYQDATALRDAASDRLDALAVRQADLGDDEGAAAYDALRRALVRDVTARGGTLARLQTYLPATTEPAIVIAHRLYGAFAVEQRSIEIARRNRVRHPGFVPGGIALQVLTPPTAASASDG